MKYFIRIISLVLTAVFFCVALGCSPEKEVKPPLTKKQIQVIREELSDMQRPVTLTSFVGENFPTSLQISTLCDAISQIERNIIRQRFSLDKNTSEAQKHGISLAPAVVIQQSSDVGIRFFGLPSGYEFSSFIETIDRMSRGDPGILPDSADSLSSLKIPVTIKVFTLPS